ncbi:MAG: hypothetical protein A2V57_04685 [Candidatus Aminicenantes bacterium RBG_19FT_COMBO_65_30]|nr:MAG: hypothetical protein A2V57_04685 [Candidatus Aminicenantes bacterium RBG_19FT_COMBO_65_30]
MIDLLKFRIFGKLAAAMLSIWSVGLKSPTSRSFGRAGRVSHLVIATVYGTALVLITVFSRF